MSGFFIKNMKATFSEGGFFELHEFMKIYEVVKTWFCEWLLERMIKPNYFFDFKHNKISGT